MLDIRYIVENTEKVKERLAQRNGSFDVDSIVALYNQKRALLKEVEAKKAVRNAASEQIALNKRKGVNCDDSIAEMKRLGNEIASLDAELNELEPKLKDAVSRLPNLPDSSVPEGKDENSNRFVTAHGVPRKFDFAPLPHWEIGENLKILDFAAAAKITGSRFTVYKGAGARLERALINFMLDTHAKKGYTEIFPPFLINRDSMFGTGQLPKFEEDAFSVAGTNYFLAPTAEVPVTNLFRAETLDSAALPIKYCAYTACFRAEAGSAGRDTRGLIRQHQFNKVELVKFCRPENSFEELEALTNDAADILALLGLPYRVMALCTGDLGFGSLKTYDLEVWLPSYNRYVEISSCSNYGDFQARRMNIRFKDTAAGGKPEFLHTLNGSGLAIGRTVAAILENFQNQGGTVTVPPALVPYVGKDTISL